MELNITHLIEDDRIYTISASIAEIGEDAARVTWKNANDLSGEKSLVSTPDELSEVRGYFRTFGAWSRDELDTMTDGEINALLYQYIAGEIRELLDLCDGDMAEYRKLSERGTISGQIFENGGEYYIYIGE